VGVTDDGGRFQIANVQPGRYQVEYLRAQGFNYRVAPGVRRADVTVGEDQHVGNIAHEMIPLGAIGGKVEDDSGDPLQNAQIQVWHYDYSSGERKLVTVDAAITDDRGQFRIFNLEAGGYFVHAWMPPDGQRDGQRLQTLPANLHRTSPETRYEAFFYPNASDIMQDLQLAAGGEVEGINFRLRSVPVYHIRGAAWRDVPDDAPLDFDFRKSSRIWASRSICHRTCGKL